MRVPIKLRTSVMGPPRVYSLSLSLVLSSLLLPFLYQATSFKHLEGSGSFKNLEGSRKGDKRGGIQKVKQYLQRYGYLNSVSHPQHDKYSSSSDSSDDEFDEVLESSLKAFQNFYHLTPTGILDSPTAALMSQPRCGYPDQPQISNTSIHPDYVFLELKWPRDQMHIHYIVSPGSLPEQPITNGFDAWAAVSNFTFERVREEVRAKLRFTVEQMDGEGRQLAEVKPSLVDPYVVLDEEDRWSVGGSVDAGSYDLETIAMHEIGHILGLAHSGVQEAVMSCTQFFPWEEPRSWLRMISMALEINTAIDHHQFL